MVTIVSLSNTSLEAPGALAHCLQHLTTLSKMAEKFRKYVKPKVTGPSDQLSLNQFFDFTIPSMRTSKIQNGHQGASKGPNWSRKEFYVGLLGTLKNFR